MTNSEAKALLNDIIDSNHELNDWERSFIDNVSKWVDQGRDPSQKQGDKIRQIYEKCTRGEDDGYMDDPNNPFLRD